VAFQFLTAKSVFEAYNDSKTYMLPYFQPLPEFRRIANNLPHPGIADYLPKTTDGTTASIVQKTPKRIIQQLPTGKVTSDTNDWLTIVASFIWTNRIIPNANYQYALIQKYWDAVGESLTVGSCTGYIPFLSHGDYFCTDLFLPNSEDILFEPGKVSDKDSNFIFMRQWYQPRDIEGIIDKEKKLKKRAEERNEKYESGWDLRALAKIKNETSTNTANGYTGNDADKKRPKGGVELITAFQDGDKAEFFTFHAASGDIVRTKTNKDPRGIKPLHTLYANTSKNNPLGKGYVELVGPLQNLLDSEVQMYQYNRALMLNPPIIKRGGWSKSQAKMIPNVVWDLGTDPNNTAEALKIDSTALNNFPANYGLMKSQLLNLLSSPDASISSEVGNPGFSKTDAGVKQQQSNVSVDDNYIRKQFETWFADISETQINLYFAERTDTEELQLDDETAAKLRDIDPESVSKDNKIRVDYATETEKLKFEVDASTSNMKDDAAERDRLVELLDLSQKYPQLQEHLQVRELVDRIVVKSGVEDPEKLTPHQNEDGEEEQEQPAVTPEMVQQMIQEAMAQKPQKNPSESLNYKDAPEDIKRQMEQQAGFQPSQDVSPIQKTIDQKDSEAQLHAVDMAHQHVQVAQPIPSDSLQPEDHDFLQQMVGLGLSEEEAGKALAMNHHGIPNDQIIQMLGDQNA
jgi:hypothetical protein